MHKIDLKTFDLNLLLVFETLMRERHVGRSGEALGLSQPAVSHALARLRHLLGDPLFVKNTSGVAPTPCAEALAWPISEALTKLRVALNERSAFDPATAERTIVIGTSDYIDLTLMPALMAELRHSAPRLNIHRRSTSRDTVLNDMKRRKVDLAIGPLNAAPGSISAIPLFNERLVLIARPGHPILGSDLTPNALAGLEYLLVSPSGDPIGSIDDVLRERGLTRRVVMTVPNFLAAPFIVAATDLVALLAERVARCLADTARVAIHPQQVPAPAWTVGLVWLANTPSDPVIDWFVDLTAKIATKI